MCDRNRQLVVLVGGDLDNNKKIPLTEHTGRREAGGVWGWRVCIFPTAAKIYVSSL